MKVLLIGGGGREHALAWKLRQSPELDVLYCAPGNAGIFKAAEAAPFDVSDHRLILKFCKEAAIDLVIIGPEAPLVAGLADTLRESGVAVFGPSAAASRLEASKSFTKAICAEENIPTADFRHFTDKEQALSYVRKQGRPLVVKADGLAAGKGVAVCETVEEAAAAVAACLGGSFGESGASVVIEERLLGEEASFFALCDGHRAIPLATARDYKRAFDGDKGPNTGGMGAISPAPIASAALADRVMRQIVTPAVDAMQERGMPFQGVLYAGVMITAEGPKLIEFNVRFGDPECQVLMLRLKSDLLPVLAAAAAGDLSRCRLAWSEETALTVVMAAKGYPGDYSKGSVIRNVAAAGNVEGVTVFHAGTALDAKGELIAQGGRVLNICATGGSISEARSRAYRAINEIEWPEGFYRTDIGLFSKGDAA